MAELLSQQEIDQLLSTVKAGVDKQTPVEIEKVIVPYDFRLPNRISKNQLRTLRNIHDTFSESISSFLMSKLQSIISINIISVDQIYYSEYVLSVSNPACLYTFDIKSTDIKGVLEISPELALTLVDRFLGGNGRGDVKIKTITPIEQRVLFIFVDKVMQELQKAWLIVGNYEFVVERFESDIDFAQITSQSESILLFSFEIMVGENSFLMNLCFATYAFDTILSKINSQNISTIRPVKYHGTSSKTILVDHIKKTDLTLKVEFGTAPIRMKDLFSLSQGDVIMLDKKVGEELTVTVADKVVFKCQPGVLGGHRAVKITKRVENEEKN
ncbi:MAG: flagellar motor switch protein FliM [Ignavibacteriales bacterium]|nr:flagellar motor switch protein FliM [Ignavibacteriales bacterium]